MRIVEAGAGLYESCGFSQVATGTESQFAFVTVSEKLHGDVLRDRKDAGSSPRIIVACAKHGRIVCNAYHPWLISAPFDARWVGVLIKVCETHPAYVSRVLQVGGYRSST